MLLLILYHSSGYSAILNDTVTEFLFNKLFAKRDTVYSAPSSELIEFLTGQIFFRLYHLISAYVFLTW